MKKRVIYGLLCAASLWGCGMNFSQTSPQNTNSLNAPTSASGSTYSDPYHQGTGYGTSYGTGYTTGYGVSPGSESSNDYQNPYQQPSASPWPHLPQPTPQATGTPATYPTPQPSQTPVPQASTTPLPQTSASSENPLQPYRDTFFRNYGVNPFIEANVDPLSTFALDVDTGSFTFGKGELERGKLPPKDSVRTEEYLNAFSYHYPQPVNSKFAIQTDLGPAYFGNGQTQLLRIGIQGKEILDRQRKDAILTYVIDVSGSMNQPQRLELVKQSLTFLLSQLRTSDKIGIVVYGSAARVLLEHTPISERAKIEAAIKSLRPEGSTNVEAGLSLGYSEATKVYQSSLINRVILCSDGVANVGPTGPDAILKTVKEKSENGITLTTLGFGMGEYNDTLMEQLANQGDGQYAYIDNLDEARRLFGVDLTSTLQVIAKDAKIQVAFNDQVVEQYRLLGYENRNLADQDFRNDLVDAGEIGSNHSVTALYELKIKPNVNQGELGTVFLRYKDIDDYLRVQEVTQKINLSQMISFKDASASFKLSMAVAEFAELLRQSVFAQDGNLESVLSLSQNLQEQAPQDTRIKEFVRMVQNASRLQSNLGTQSATPVETLISKSENPQKLPDWHSYLLKQLGGAGLQ